MTYISRFRSAGGTITAVYTCPEHGEFTAEVQREENGDAPDVIPCPVVVGVVSLSNVTGAVANAACGRWATWTPTVVACRVRRIEAVKGKWEPPARSTYLDTRELGEGMDIDDFREKRAAVWEKKRQEDVMAVKKGFG